MKTLYDQLHEITRDVTLSTAERDELRGALTEYMRYKPIRRTTPRTMYGQLRRAPLFALHHLRGAVAIALIVAVSTGGVSYAATDALPGDLLYPVKVDVNEELKTVLLTSDESRIDWERERAELRLVEASQLAAEGRLDTEKAGEVVRRFEEHADAVVAHVRAVEEEDPFLVAEVAEEFESALDTHEAVLARLVMDQETPAVEETRDLFEQVHTVAAEAAKMRVDAEEQIALGEDIAISTPDTMFATTAQPDVVGDTQGTDTDPIAVEQPSAHIREQVLTRAKERAEQQYARVIDRVAQSESTTAPLTDVNSQIEKGKSDLAHAQALLEQGDTRNAYRAYREVGSTFQKIGQMLDVQHMFAIEIPTTTHATGSEELTHGLVTPDLSSLHADVVNKVAHAREELLTAQGIDSEKSDQINDHIKNAAASVLRGEIAQSLHEDDSARSHYREVLILVDRAIELIELYRERTVLPSEDGGQSVTNDKQAGQTPLVPAPRILAITEQVADGARVYTGALPSGTCALLASEVQTGTSTDGGITLILSTANTVPCDIPGEVTFRASTSSMGGELRAVVLDGVEQAFGLVRNNEGQATDATESLEEQAVEMSAGVFKRVFEVTQDLLTPPSN